MGAEYGSGRAKAIFTSASVVVANTGGSFPAPLTRTFRLHLMNEAGVSLASDPVSASVPAGGRVTVSFPEANRDAATGYKYCFVSASADGSPENAWVVGCWRIFQTGSESFATASPLIFSRPEHLVVPSAVVASPALLPTGADILPGMVRLVSGGVTSGASYYIHLPWLPTNPNSPFFQYEIDGDRAIERAPGEYWVRFGNPQFGIFPLGGDLRSDGGAWRPMVAVDPDAIANSLLFGTNYAASDSASDEAMIAPAPLIVHFGSDTGDDIPASRFGLHVRIDGINATTLMDRRIAVKFLGFYDPATGTIDTSSGQNDGASMSGIGEVLFQDGGSSGFLATSKTLPGNQKAVFKMYPRFRASEIYPALVNGTEIQILPVLLPSGGVRVPIASLFENSQGGFVAPGGEFGRVLPGDGTITVLPGRFVVRGFESAMQLKQTVVEVMPNTLNQQITVTKDGKATVRGTVGAQTVPSTEALLAIVDFGIGESKVSNWSNPIALSANSGLNITATYPVSGTFGQIRNDINEIGGNIKAHFNPPQVRIYVLLGSTIYRLNDLQPVTISTSQTFSITNLSNATVVGSLPNPPFPDFCLFDPPTAVASATTGSLATGTYQVAIAYAYTAGTQCTRIRQTVADGCIPAYRESLFESRSSGFVEALKNLTTAGLIERTTGGGAITNAVAAFGKSLLNLANEAAARLAFGLGNSATRNVGTTTNTVAAGDDSRLTNARTPTSHASTHQAGGADEIPIFGFLAVSANTTLNATHERQLIEVNATSAAITLTLPAAATVGAGFQLDIGKSDASVNNVVISRSGSDTINGAATITLTAQFQRVTLRSFGGTFWGVVASFDNWVRAKSTTIYGSFSASGSAGEHAGIHFPQSSDGQILMFGTASRHCGVWSPSAGGGWHWLYNAGNLSIHSSDAASEGAFIGLFKGLNALPGYPSNRFPTVRTDFSTLYFSVAGNYSAYISGSGVYTAVSDKNKKTVVEKINPLSTLNFISQLPINRFFYNGEDDRITHIGTFAQDFYKKFKCGGSDEIVNDDSPISPDKMLATSDVAGVCLSGIQGLIIENKELKNRLQKMENILNA